MHDGIALIFCYFWSLNNCATLVLQMTKAFKNDSVLINHMVIDVAIFARSA